MYLGQVPSELKDLTVVEAGRRGNDCSALASKPFGLLSRLCEKVAGSAGVNRPYGFIWHGDNVGYRRGPGSWYPDPHDGRDCFPRRIALKGEVQDDWLSRPLKGE